MFAELCWIMLSYAKVCRVMLSYYKLFQVMPSYAGIFWLILSKSCQNMIECVEFLTLCAWFQLICNLE